MHNIKTINAIAMPTGTALPWMVLFALSTLPLFALQLSIASTLQLAGLLSLAMVALAHLSVADEQHFDAAHLAIKLVAPLQFTLMIWLAVQLSHSIAGISFTASFFGSIICLSGIVVVDALASAALALIAGSCRSVTGLSLVTLISAKYAGLLGGVK
jgi:hypothetical protein